MRHLVFGILTYLARAALLMVTTGASKVGSSEAIAYAAELCDLSDDAALGVQAQMVLPSTHTYAWWGPHGIMLYAAYKTMKAKDAHCFPCGKDLNFQGSQRNLDRHWQSVHTKDQATRVHAGSIDRFLETASSFKWQLTRWMVQTAQPLSTPEHPAFKGMIRSVSSRVSIPTSREVCDMLDELESRARMAVSESLRGQFVALTSDAWTSMMQEAFLALTVSYIDETFTPISFPLQCSPFPGSHTGERILEKITQMLEESGVSDDHVSALVQDNGANGQKAGRLASYDSIPCVPHTLQLTVKRLLEAEGVAHVLKTCRGIVAAFKHSAGKCEELYHEQTLLGLPKRRMIQYSPTRWSGCLMSVKSLLVNRKAVEIVSMRHAEPSSAPARKKAKLTSTDSVADDTGDGSVSDCATPQQPRRVTRFTSGTIDRDVNYAPPDSSDYYSSSDDGSVDIECQADSALLEDRPVVQISSGSESDFESGEARQSKPGGCTFTQPKTKNVQRRKVAQAAKQAVKVTASAKARPAAKTKGV